MWEEYDHILIVSVLCVCVFVCVYACFSGYKNIQDRRQRLKAVMNCRKMGPSAKLTRDFPSLCPYIDLQIKQKDCFLFLLQVEEMSSAR